MAGINKTIREVLDSMALDADIIANFEREKITFDIVMLLDNDEFQCLGLNADTANTLKNRCLEIINNSSKVIDREKLQSLVELGYSTLEIANIMKVSRRTIFRRLEMYGMSAVQFSDIDDQTLDYHMKDILSTHSNCGEVMVKGFLHERGIKVPRQVMRNSLHRVNSEGSIARRRRRLHRRVYSVPGPNHLWHVDGNHKLIRWGFVIHGGVDGFSRLPVYLNCSTNNKASSVLAAFQQAIEKFGLPLRVRSDAGRENVHLWQYMQEAQGIGSIIIGKSTHNQRIERLWRDVFEGCLHHFYKLFYNLEDQGYLNHLNEVQLFTLQYVFLPRINKSLQEWSVAWCNHKIRTVGKTPLQMWFSGQLEKPVGVETFEGNGTDIEVHAGNPSTNNVHTPHITVNEPTNPLNNDAYEQLKQAIDPQRESTQHGVDIYFDALQFIHSQL